MDIVNNKTINSFLKTIGILVEDHSAPKQNQEVWIQTYTGKKFHPLNPSPNEICLLDVAHALSMLCRFTGHTNSFYSVAQHSILVSDYCAPEYALYGLIHDASEAFLQDWASPIKRSGNFENYRSYEHTLQSMIYQKFGLEPVEPANIKETDLRLLATEARDLMTPLRPDFGLTHQAYDFHIIPLDPAACEVLFLERFKELVGPQDYEKWINE